MRRCLVLWMLTCCPALAQTPVVDLAHTPDPVGTFDKLEITFRLNAVYNNPFDPDEVDVCVEFGRSGQTMRTIPAFWYEGQTITRAANGNEVITPNGVQTWMARLALETPGSWSYRVVVNDVRGQGISPWQSVVCVASNRRGFVRIDARDPRFLVLDDGTPFRPIGHNISWPRLPGLFDLLDWQAKMAAQGENWGKYWLSQHTAFQALEWKAGGYWSGLGRYAQPICARIDGALEDARAKGIRIQLTLDSYNAWNEQYYPNWNDNPYNQARGGMLAAPHEYFTNAAAKALARKRFRYIAARWAYSTSIFCWEFFNEIDILGAGGPPSGFFINNFDSALRWHQEMAVYLRSVDPFAHLRSTSFSGQTGQLKYPEFWELPEMELVQVHHYSDNSPASHVALVNQGWIHSKPVLLSEWGRDSIPQPAGQTKVLIEPEPYIPYGMVAIQDRVTPLSVAYIDPTGQTLHDAIWALAMVGSSAMSWWWYEWIDPANLYPVFRPLALFLAGEDWAAQTLTLGSVAWRPASGHDLAVYGSSGWNHAYLWVHYRPGGTANNVQIDVLGLIDAPKRVEYWNPYTGTIAASGDLPVSGGILRLTFPSFTRDLAVKVIGVPGSPTPTPSATPSPTPRGDNLVHNPGGERGSLEGWTGWEHYPYDADGPPVDWPGRCPLMLDPSVQPPSSGRFRYSGNHGFGSSIGWSSGRGGMYQEIAVRPAATYRLSCWAATGGPDDDEIQMGWIDGTGVWVRDQGIPGQPRMLGRIGAARDWTQLSGEIRPSTTPITIYADWRHHWPSGAASFFVDDWALVETAPPPAAGALLESW